MTRPDQTRPDQTRPDQTNYDLLYDKEFYGDTFYVNHFVDKKLTFRVIENGYILPFTPANEGGVFDSTGNHVKGSTITNHYAFDPNTHVSSEAGLRTLAESLNFNISEAIHKHSTVVHIGVLIKTWGHFITDSMRFLWFLKSRDYLDNFSECPLTYFPSLGFQLKGNWQRILEILGINTSLLTPITELTKYDRIIVPDESFALTSSKNYYFTSEYVECIDCIRNFAATQSLSEHKKKIYFSYSKYKQNMSTGEDKLEKYFASKGYEIIYPEKLPIDEQLNILINCSNFAATIGSCSHNALFLKDDTEIILIPRANYLNDYQLAIDQVHPQNIHYIDCSFSIFAGKSPWGGPFLYFISSNLRKFFNDPDTESIICSSDFWKYVRLSRGFSISSAFGRAAHGDNPDVYKYYSTVAAEYFGKLFSMSWPYKLRQWLKELLKRK